MTKRMTSRTWAFILAFGSIYLIWGSTYVAIRIAVQTIPPFIMLASRFGLAGIIIYGILRAMGSEKPTLSQWKSTFIVGGLMLGGGTGALAWSEQFISSGLAALLVTTAPLWMVLLDWLWVGNERPGPITFLGILTGFVGVVILIDPVGVLSTVSINYLAAFVVVGGALSWSVGSLRSRASNLPDNPFMAAAMQMISGGFVLVILAVVSGELSSFDASAISRSSFLSWVYLFAIGSFIPFNAYIWLMRNTTPAAVSTYAFVNPIVAVVLGWGLAGESVSLNMIIAIALLLVAVILITQQGRRKAQVRKSIPPLVCYELNSERRLVESTDNEPAIANTHPTLSSVG